MSGAQGVLQMKEEDGLKSLAGGTHLGGTNLDFQEEQYVNKRKGDAIYIINLKRTLTSSDTFYLQMRTHTLPGSSAATWDPETQTAQGLHTPGWGHQHTDLSPRDRHPAQSSEKAQSGTRADKPSSEASAQAHDMHSHKISHSLASPPKTRSQASRYTNSSCDATPSDTHPPVA